MGTINREIKSSLFIDYFGKDPVVGKENFLDLYNALHGTSLDLATTSMELKEIESTAYKTFQNDLGMLVDGRIVVLMEHQSTLNPNMPFRLLEYITRIYTEMVPLRKRYSSGTLSLPSPEFYVFYNGKRPMPLHSRMRLSDCYMVPVEHPMLELTVDVYNINARDFPDCINSGKLREYNRFVEYFFCHADLSDPESCREAILGAVRENIMGEYLERKVKEVRDMLCAEYDYEEDIAVKTEESYNQGFQKGEASGFQQGKTSGSTEFCLLLLAKGLLSKEEASENLGITMEKLEELIASYRKE